MRTTSLLLLATLFAAACTDSTAGDELAGESSADGEGGDGKADANGTYTYYDIWNDQRACSSPMCGGVFVDRVNRAETACAGGVGGPVYQPSCYASDIDWSDAGMSQDQIDAVTGMIEDGGRVLIRGHLRSVDRGSIGSWPRLFVDEAWVAQTDGWPDGVFVKVKDAGIRCIAAPCESLGEYKLNSALSSTIAGLDYEPSGADDSVAEKAGEAMFHDGVIVSGYRYTIYESGRQARGREAYQVWLRVTDAAPVGQN